MSSTHPREAKPPEFLLRMAAVLSANAHAIGKAARGTAVRFCFSFDEVWVLRIGLRGVGLFKNVPAISPEVVVKGSAERVVRLILEGRPEPEVQVGGDSIAILEALQAALRPRSDWVGIRSSVPSACNPE